MGTYSKFTCLKICWVASLLPFQHISYQIIYILGSRECFSNEETKLIHQQIVVDIIINVCTIYPWKMMINSNQNFFRSSKWLWWCEGENHTFSWIQSFLISLDFPFLCSFWKLHIMICFREVCKCQQIVLKNKNERNQYSWRGVSGIMFFVIINYSYSQTDKQLLKKIF